MKSPGIGEKRDLVTVEPFLGQLEYYKMMQERQTKIVRKLVKRDNFDDVAIKFSASGNTPLCIEGRSYFIGKEIKTTF